MRAQLLLGGDDGRLTDVTDRAGPAFEELAVDGELLVGED